MTRSGTTGIQQGIDHGTRSARGVSVRRPLIWMISAQQDPYVEPALNFQVIQMWDSCSGSTVLVAMGWQGKDCTALKLAGISERMRDPALIHQIVSGDTPPMPSFQMEPASMADLLSHLHNLS